MLALFIRFAKRHQISFEVQLLCPKGLINYQTKSTHRLWCIKHTWFLHQPTLCHLRGPFELSFVHRSEMGPCLDCKAHQDPSSHYIWSYLEVQHPFHLHLKRLVLIYMRVGIYHTFMPFERLGFWTRDPTFTPFESLSSFVSRVVLAHSKLWSDGTREWNYWFETEVWRLQIEWIIIVKYYSSVDLV